jgi:glycosyltransferase involved in cell wall biosynthesis
VGEDGETGLLVEPANGSALAGAIARLLQDGALRERLAEAGRRRVLAHFTWERAAERTVEAYRDVMERRAFRERRQWAGGAPC